MIKNILLVGFLLISLFANTRPSVPMPDIGKIENDPHRNFKCKVPEFLVNLHPLIEKDYKECINNRNWPSTKLAQTVLKQQIDKRAKLGRIEVAKEFYSRVYRVEYIIGNKRKWLICNEKLTYCLKDEPVATRKR